MELKATKYQVDRCVAMLALSRPARRNAWTGRMHAEYRWCCAQAEADTSVRSIVVYGDPEGRAFSPGADSDALAGHVSRGGYDDGLGDEAIATPGSGVHPNVEAHYAWQLALRIPMIAAINGACAGVALAAASYCDIRFVASDAVLATAAPKLGLPAEYGLSWILPRLIPRLHANDWLLSGRRVTGEEAAAAGYAFRSQDAESTLSDAVAYARRLADDVAPSSLMMTKRQLLEDYFRHDVGESVRNADDLLRTAMQGADFAEGVAALRERRAPRFA